MTTGDVSSEPERCQSSGRDRASAHASTVDACALKPHTELRNRAFLAILYRTGLWRSEALALEPKDVDFFGSSIRVLHAAALTFDTPLLDHVESALIDADRTRPIPLPQSLFCTQTGKAMSGSYVREQIKRLGIKAGISKRVHAHGLRHTHAFELMMEDIPISIIQRQLGHASLRRPTPTYRTSLRSTSSRRSPAVSGEPTPAGTHRRSLRSARVGSPNR